MLVAGVNARFADNFRGMRDQIVELYELSFAKIIIIRDDIAEVIIDKDIEMNANMVEQYHEFLLAHLRHPFSLLINKVNSYTYDFDAQLNIAKLKEINAMAVVAYNRMAVSAAKSLESVAKWDKEWNLNIFSNRDEALTWLVSEQDKSNK